MNNETNSNAPTKPRVRAITGLRFLAAFAVMYYHFGMQFEFPYCFHSYGTMAVSFFFVLSGFILTYVSLGKLKLEPENLYKFYVKRIARIWPIHFLTLLYGAYIIGIETNRTIYWANFFLLHSWVPINDWTFSYNVVSWSISTEIFFSFMLPIFLIGGQRQFWMKYLTLWAIVIGIVVYVNHLYHGGKLSGEYDLFRVVHMNPIVRLPEFCAGIGLGYLFLNRSSNETKRSVFGSTIWELLALAAVLIFFYFNDAAYSAIYQSQIGIVGAQWYVFTGGWPIFAFVVWTFVQSNGLVSRILDWRPLVLLGEASYSLFMIHFPIFWFFMNMDWSASSIPLWVVGWALMLFSMAASIIVFGFIEQPARFAIVELSQLRFGSAIATYFRYLGQFLKTASFWISLPVAIACLVLVQFSYVAPSTNQEWNRIVKSTPVELRDIQFGDQFLLKGFEIKTQGRGISVNLVWKKLKENSFKRFTHITDSEGQIVDYFPTEAERLTDLPPNAQTTEQFFVPVNKLTGNRNLGIGFYTDEINPDTGKVYAMLIANKGSRTMYSMRLELIEHEQLNELLKSIAEVGDEPEKH